MPRRLVQDGYRGLYGWEGRFNSVMRMSVNNLWSIKAKNEHEKHNMSTKMVLINRGEKHTKQRLNFESKVVKKDFVKMKASTAVLREYSFYRMDEKLEQTAAKVSTAPDATVPPRERARVVKRSHTFHHGQGQSKGYDRLTIHESDTPLVRTERRPVLRATSDTGGKGETRPVQHAAIHNTAARPKQLADSEGVIKNTSTYNYVCPSDGIVEEDAQNDQSARITQHIGNIDLVSREASAGKNAKASIGADPPTNQGERIINGRSSSTPDNIRVPTSKKRVRFPDLQEQPDKSAASGQEDTGEEANKDHKDGERAKDHALISCILTSKREQASTPSPSDSGPPQPPVSDDKTKGDARSLPAVPHRPPTVESRAGSRASIPGKSSPKPVLTKAAFSMDQGRTPQSPNRASLFYDNAEDDKLKDYILPQHPQTLVWRNATKAKQLSLEKRLALRSRNLVPEDHKQSKIFPEDCKTAFSFKKFIERKTEKVVDGWTSDKVRMRKMKRIAHKIQLPELVQRSKTTSAIFRDYRKYRDETRPPLAKAEQVPVVSPMSRVRARIRVKQENNKLPLA